MQKYWFDFWDFEKDIHLMTLVFKDDEAYDAMRNLVQIKSLIS
jgi:hypothetical protein